MNRLCRAPARIGLLFAVLACPSHVKASTDIFVCIVGGLTPTSGFKNFGASGGIRAFSVDTVACNGGNTPAPWIGTTNQHPVMTQNMFRLRAGRFEQIGQSWVKHGFYPQTNDGCTICTPPTPNDGTLLGVGCCDTYTAYLNGVQVNIGPKSEINPSTGDFPYPFCVNGCPSPDPTIGRRLQVADSDLDTSPVVLYFIEAQYIIRSDCAALPRTDGNNSSYRQIHISPTTNNLAEWIGDTVGYASTLTAWANHDTGVHLNSADVPFDGTYYVAAKVTDLNNGTWHYEYAVQNFNSDRAGASFSVPVAPGVTISNVGFHGVAYHSGEPYDNTDWDLPANGPSTGALIWSSHPYPTYPGNANALRWGTTYNFRFDADVSPVPSQVTVTLFKPGNIPTVSIDTIAPKLCNCPGDMNGDGQIDGADIQAFVISFSEGTINGCANLATPPGGSIGDADLALFVNMLLSGDGCPPLNTTVAVTQNGLVVPNPQYPYSMDSYARGDLPGLRAWAANENLFAGIDMGLDWKLREWDMIKAIVDYVSRELHYTGFDSDPAPAPRALHILSSRGGDGVIQGWSDSDFFHNVSGGNFPTVNSGFVAVSAGLFHSMALRKEGNVEVWGGNNYEQGVPPADNSNISAISCGANHNLALKRDGSIIAWGLDGAGQGNTSTLSPNSGFIAIAAGQFHNLALRNDGTVTGWGSNGAGQCDVPGEYQSHFVRIATGGTHSVGLLDDGRVVCWGNNTNGQCTVPQFFPNTQIPLQGHVIAITAGGAFTEVLCDKLCGNSVIGWGTGATAWASGLSGVTDLYSRPSATTGVGVIKNAVPTLFDVAISATPPPAPPGMGYTGLAIGGDFALGLANHVWICASVSETILGLCVAHGIPARLVGGYGIHCSRDEMVEVFSTRFNKWIFLLGPYGSWVEDGNGVPQSLSDLRRHQAYGDIAITRGYSLSEVGYSASARNGSGLVFKPDSICSAPLAPHLTIPWWSGYTTALGGVDDEEGDLLRYTQTGFISRLNSPAPVGQDLLNDQYIVDVLNSQCNLGLVNFTVVSIDDPNLTYPLNNVQATARLVGPYDVEITLVHNMNDNTPDAAFDHYEMSIDGGASWHLLWLEDLGGGVYLWFPAGPSTLMIRGVNVAGVHSPEVVVHFSLY